MTKNITLIISAILLIFTLSFCGSDQKTETPDNQNSSSTATATADVPANPNVDDLFIFAAYDTKGTLRKSTEWIGQKPVVINFWGTWCPPCRMAIPDLAKLYDEYRDRGVEIIGIALRDNAQQVSRFAGANGMEWVMLLGDKPLAQKFEISSVPTTYFIDKDGQVMKVNEPALGGKADYFKGAKSYETFKAAFEELVNM